MAAKTGAMPKPERKAVILDYFAENDVLLPTGLAHTNLREYRDITFSEKTTKRMLYELRDDGLMEAVDRGGYNLYRITPAGRERVEHGSD